MEFVGLVDRHLGLALRKQLALMDFLGEHTWQLDLDSGTVDFGRSGLFARKRVYPVQVLGTEADAAQTWLWAWANEASGIPPSLLRAVNRVKALGQSQGIAELTQPELPLASFPGHILASVCSAICHADGYYRGPYDGGAVYFLLSGTPLASPSPTPVPRMIAVLTDAISQQPVNHHAMATAYLRAEGLTLKQEGTTLTASAPDGRSLTVSFDPQNRISDIRARVG